MRLIQSYYFCIVIDALVSLTDSIIKILRYFLKCWRLENLLTCRSRFVTVKKMLFWSFILGQKSGIIEMVPVSSGPNQFIRRKMSCGGALFRFYNGRRPSNLLMCSLVPMKIDFKLLWLWKSIYTCIFCSKGHLCLRFCFSDSCEKFILKLSIFKSFSSIH